MEANSLATSTLSTSTRTRRCPTTDGDGDDPNTPLTLLASPDGGQLVDFSPIDPPNGDRHDAGMHTRQEVVAKFAKFCKSIDYLHIIKKNL